MEDVRWKSPFCNTLAFTLFKKHFTELNDCYWAFVPAAATIIGKSKKVLHNTDDPKSYFLIHDEDDRRMAPTYEVWREHFKEFENYTRLNMVMLLSSCFETYLRTVVSQAFESKPGVIIMCPDSIDGVFLLKKGRDMGIVVTVRISLPIKSMKFVEANGLKDSTLLKNILAHYQRILQVKLLPWIK